ncbi:hypothetical protein [Leptodesmis sichuanensis]|uniref:hypothetical protein n=1 Tax=Leptodesmis sichuanensis TaxID=2906798 RepID=UPI001F39CFE5|nr:hypothetical protein [Leptodesmis sichuanensis]UIE36431.1 hypothetical protein KIK02_15370 [Leptodesmis sichuanensis A121]
MPLLQSGIEPQNFHILTRRSGICSDAEWGFEKQVSPTLFVLQGQPQDHLFTIAPTRSDQTCYIS